MVQIMVIAPIRCKVCNFLSSLIIFEVACAIKSIQQFDKNSTPAGAAVYRWDDGLWFIVAFLNVSNCLRYVRKTVKSHRCGRRLKIVCMRCCLLAIRFRDNAFPLLDHNGGTSRYYIHEDRTTHWFVCTITSQRISSYATARW